jgi:3-methyladenine DNA glycosylase Mpg
MKDTLRLYRMVTEVDGIPTAVLIRVLDRRIVELEKKGRDR